MVLIKRGLDAKSHVRVLNDEDVVIDEDKAKKALSDAKTATKTLKGNGSDKTQNSTDK